jgi:hypothetical protein
MIQLQYQVTLDDYREAWRPHLQKRSGRVPSWLLSAIFLLLGLAMLFLFPRDFISGMFCGVILVMGVLLLFVSMLQQRSVATIWNNNPFLAKHQAARVSAEGMSIWGEHSRIEISWGAYTHWSETPNLFLLHLSEVTFYTFPKRAFANADEVNQFRALLNNIGVASSAPPIPEPT